MPAVARMYFQAGVASRSSLAHDQAHTWLACGREAWIGDQSEQQIAPTPGRRRSLRGPLALRASASSAMMKPGISNATAARIATDVPSIYPASLSAADDPLRITTADGRARSRRVDRFSPLHAVLDAGVVGAIQPATRANTAREADNHDHEAHALTVKLLPHPRPPSAPRDVQPRRRMRASARPGGDDES